MVVDGPHADEELTGSKPGRREPPPPQGAGRSDEPATSTKPGEPAQLDPPQESASAWERKRAWLHEVIFEADTPVGKMFDIGLLLAIIASVVVVSLETIEPLQARYGWWLKLAEWIFTILFTIEYVVRLLAVKKPSAYAKSFFGVVDLLAILPTYLSLFIPGTHELVVIRALRILRVFRVFKLGRFLREGDALWVALLAARAKLVVFAVTVLTIVTIMGATMHLVEGPDNGFTSIPTGMYWAIVTMSTVGYGDISPQTPVGKVIASMLILLGYSLIIVPGSIITAEAVRRPPGPLSTQHCPHCGREGHMGDAVFCKYCGEKL